jgi:superfamily II DNA/RNA helicase
MLFSELSVSEELVKGLRDVGLKTPTNIQERTIPLIIEGRDVIGISKTGSGKTAAFGVPILSKIKQGNGIQALVIAPIRELSVQITKEFHKFGKYIDFSTTTVYGGVSINPQIESMKKADIVVGTPGRLRDHLENHAMDLSKVKTLVLDEADKMVEMGFVEDIRVIMDKVPRDAQILLFGATISDEIEQIKKEYMNGPIDIRAESHVKEEFLEQYYYNVPQHEKFSLLVHLLKKEEKELTMIFCSARSTVELVTKNLNNHGIKAAMIHGKMGQSARLRAMENFHKGRPNILVASAVAARGLDIKDVTHIFNYDLSQDPQEYIHRVGRTARAGEKGKAITLLSERDHDAFREILYRYPIDVKELPIVNFEKLRFDARRSNGFRPRNRFRGNSGHGYNRGSSPGRSNFRSGNSGQGRRSGGESSSGNGFGSRGRFGSRNRRFGNRN